MVGLEQPQIRRKKVSNLVGCTIALVGTLCFSAFTELHAQSTGRDEASSPPAQLAASALADLGSASPSRQALVTLALKTASDQPLDRYIFGSADPKQGGFDCSGAMYYILTRAGLQPPRSSAAQFDWVKEAGNLVSVPADTTSLDNKLFDRLKPGDLLFWSGTYIPTDGRTNKITHVQMYLGREKQDQRPVMIGSSDGRSYRGRRQCGFGVFDFRLPHRGSKSKLVGFGAPPGLQQPATAKTVEHSQPD